MKTVNILGATGSIGDNTLQLVRQNKSLKVEVLTGYFNAQKLVKLALEFKPKIIAIGEAEHYVYIKEALRNEKIEILLGSKGIEEAASQPSDITVCGILGIAALKPIMCAIKAGCKLLALANKESLVCAGNILLNTILEHKTKLIPLDSEHNALFQILEGANAQVEKLVITASGGPFREYTRAQMAEVTPQIAAQHPNWKMGAKISVDSATLANKGLEYIEAQVLFKPKLLEILVHPQSIVHAMVYYRDGSVFSQMYKPDMKVSISHALNYPQRGTFEYQELDLVKIENLSFYLPDYKKFPLLLAAKEAYEASLAHCIVFNGANEAAVNAFLQGRIKFLDIESFVLQALEKVQTQDFNTIEEVLEYNKFFVSRLNLKY